MPSTVLNRWKSKQKTPKKRLKMRLTRNLLKNSAMQPKKALTRQKKPPTAILLLKMLSPILRPMHYRLRSTHLKNSELKAKPPSTKCRRRPEFQRRRCPNIRTPSKMCTQVITVTALKMSPLPARRLLKFSARLTMPTLTAYLKTLSLCVIFMIWISKSSCERSTL